MSCFFIRITQYKRTHTHSPLRIHVRKALIPEVTKLRRLSRRGEERRLPLNAGGKTWKNPRVGGSAEISRPTGHHRPNTIGLRD
jgi:hypothetical protein